MFNNYIRIIRILFIFILGSVLSAQSVEELKRLREAYEDMKEAQEAEAIIQEGNEFSVAKFLDLEIFLMGEGRERTLEEFNQLFSASGLRIINITVYKNTH